jgi:hypothetical protein
MSIENGCKGLENRWYSGFDLSDLLSQALKKISGKKEWKWYKNQMADH